MTSRVRQKCQLPNSIIKVHISLINNKLRDLLALLIVSTKPGHFLTVIWALYAGDSALMSVINMNVVSKLIWWNCLWVMLIYMCARRSHSNCLKHQWFNRRLHIHLREKERAPKSTQRKYTAFIISWLCIIISSHQQHDMNKYVHQFCFFLRWRCSV